MKVSWKFYLQRKKKTLSDFLSGVRTLEEAKSFFDEIDISPPSDRRILDALEEQKLDREKRLAEEKERNSVPKKTTPRSSKKTTKKKAGAPKKTSKDSLNKETEKSNEKYFRKVVPKRKK